MTIGERIKSLRTEKGMTQTELAELLQTTKQNIFKYENGIVTNIPSDKIEKMAEIFGIEPATLMGWAESKISATAPAKVRCSLRTRTITLNAWSRYTKAVTY